ncbi:MAG: outer membrane protein assembly factor [Acidobacteria bacterium]|nr:outer membrane protein assembly factor [Acidobacteriota bacterium]
MGGVGAEFGNIGGGTGLSAPAGEAAFAPRVSLGISRLNFLGLGHTVSLQTRLSTLQERGVINYFAPQFRGSEKLNLTFSGLFDNSRNVRTFSSRRREGSLQLSQRFTRAITAQYRYTYRHVKIYDVKIDPGLIPLYSQPARVGLIAGAIINDRRDDPLNATRGYYYSADFSGATRAFGSESSFTRLLGRNSSYHRLTRDLVVSRNTMFGWIHNFGSRDIPLPEHFFAGGSVSHRGFPENQAGPRDLVTGFPIGGRALLFNQTELRFPFIGTKLAGVVFHDAGNVYTNVSAISFRFHQRGETDFDYMVHAAGIGVRYRTPVGPVRLDFAFGLNSPRFFGYTGSIDDLINRRGQRLMQRIGLFQFHFSLGQAF